MYFRSAQIKIKPDPIATDGKIKPKVNQGTSHMRSTMKLISFIYSMYYYEIAKHTRHTTAIA